MFHQRMLEKKTLKQCDNSIDYDGQFCDTTTQLFNPQITHFAPTILLLLAVVILINCVYDSELIFTHFALSASEVGTQTFNPIQFQLTQPIKVIIPPSTYPYGYLHPRVRWVCGSVDGGSITTLANFPVIFLSIVIFLLSKPSSSWFYQTLTLLYDMDLR